MNKQTIAIISIIAVGSLFGVGYATGTVITNTGITTGNLVVTGTCTGCGAGTITKNATVTSSDLVNSVIISPFTCDTLGGKMFEDVLNLYDGVVAIQVQKEDNSWTTDKGNLGGSIFYIVSNNYFGTGSGVIGQTSDEKIPLNIRMIVTSQATVGNYTINLRCS